MDPKSVFGIARLFFFALPKKKLEMVGIGNEGGAVSCSVPSWLFSFAPTLWAVEKPDPWQGCHLHGVVPGW